MPFLVDSEAEARWLMEVIPWQHFGKIRKLRWQPRGFEISIDDGWYRPDAIVEWPDGAVEIIEIKFGKIEQKSKNKMLAFCREHPDKRLVIVWFGSLPRKGIHARRLNELRPHIHRIWRFK